MTSLRRSGATVPGLILILGCWLPLLGLLILLFIQVHRMPRAERLRLLSVEGTPIYYNPVAPKNPDLMLKEREPGLREKQRIVDYLLRRPMERLGPEGFTHSLAARIIVTTGAILLDGALSGPDILDLTILLEDGRLPDPVSQRPALELEHAGFRGEIRSTLSENQQQSIRSIVDSELMVLRGEGAYQASVVVLERDRSVLKLRAMVDTGGEKGLNGALLIRQSGSVLKPFLYALAFEQLGWRPRTMIDDTPLRLPLGPEVYEPRNHDGRFAGPITVREALASSRNIPAIRTLLAIGEDRYRSFLTEAGLNHIRPAHEYGPTLALGTGGASTLQTALLFSILAAQGELHPLLLGNDGDPIYLNAIGRPSRSAPPSHRFFLPQTALLVTHILIDREARRISFGRRNFLDFPFDVAAKTGTSQSYRDSWTAGYTGRYVVAVWVGNFSGRSMEAVSGLRGAARIFHQVIRMLAGNDHPAFHFPGDWRQAPVCRSTGKPAGAVPGGCPSMLEVFPPDEEEKATDRRRDSRTIQSPFPGQTFYLDPHRPRGQDIPVEFLECMQCTWTLSRSGHSLPEFRGRPVRPGTMLLPLERGEYDLRVHSPERGEERIDFKVK